MKLIIRHILAAVLLLAATSGATEAGPRKRTGGGWDANGPSAAGVAGKEAVGTATKVELQASRKTRQ